MKKLFAFLVSITITAFAFTGCTSKDTESSENSSKADNSATEVSQNDSGEDSATQSEFPASTDPIDVSKGATDNMLQRSVLNVGDTSRLAQKLDVALNGDKQITKIAFLGDSITAGSSASSSQNQYVKQFTKWWEDNVSFYVDVANAGIGATDSYLGVHRVQEDVLDDNPDIIFIEFINDTDDEFYQASMDSLVRKCLSQENNPAVIMIEMTMDDGTSPQRVHSEIATAYNVPMISYHDAIMPEIESGSIKWSEISPDNIHPNDKGHIMLAQMLESFVGSVKDDLDSLDKASEKFDEESPTGDKYANANMGGRLNVTVLDEGEFILNTAFQTFNNGWSTISGGEITFEMEFKNLGMLYLKTVDGKNASVTINVDGDDVTSINGDFTGGWGNFAKADEIYTSDKAEKHTVKVTVDEGDAVNFQILSWLLS